VHMHVRSFYSFMRQLKRNKVFPTMLNSPPIQVFFASSRRLPPWVPSLCSPQLGLHFLLKLHLNNDAKGGKAYGKRLKLAYGRHQPILLIKEGEIGVTNPTRQAIRTSELYASFSGLTVSLDQPNSFMNCS
jgi:hypothetical protein